MERRETRQPLPLEHVAPERSGRPVASTSAQRSVPATAFAETRRYERGRTVLAQGSLAEGLFVVREGLLREAAVSPDGRWFVHALLGRGDVFGTMTASTPMPASVRTLRTSTLHVLGTEEIDAALSRRPDVGRWLMEGLERRALRGQRLAHDLAWSDAAVRLRRRLLALARDHGRRTLTGVRVDVPVTQEDLGAMIGATRETVNRTLVRLIAAGFLRIEGRRYVLLQPLVDALEDDADA
jgi:CRP/FNR family transcriptional regulator, cyclic AMP receptor protein